MKNYLRPFICVLLLTVHATAGDERKSLCTTDGVSLKSVRLSTLMRLQRNAGLDPMHTGRGSFSNIGALIRMTGGKVREPVRRDLENVLEDLLDSTPDKSYVAARWDAIQTKMKSLSKGEAKKWIQETYPEKLGQNLRILEDEAQRLIAKMHQNPDQRTLGDRLRFVDEQTSEEIGELNNEANWARLEELQEEQELILLELKTVEAAQNADSTWAKLVRKNNKICCGISKVVDQLFACIAVACISTARALKPKSKELQALEANFEEGYKEPPALPPSKDE